MQGQSTRSTNWTKEQDDFLREQYRAISTKAIGSRLGKSKNAVIGRAHRLGLGKPYSEVFGRLATNSPNRQYSRKGKGSGKRVGPEGFYRRVRKMPYIDLAEEVKALNGVGVKLWELESTHCRWVIGEPKDLTFCGNHKHTGSSYCEGHFAASKQRKA